MPVPFGSVSKFFLGALRIFFAISASTLQCEPRIVTRESLRKFVANARVTFHSRFFARKLPSAATALSSPASHPKFASMSRRIA